MSIMTMIIALDLMVLVYAKKVKSNFGILEKSGIGTFRTFLVTSKSVEIDHGFEIG